MKPDARLLAAIALVVAIAALGVALFRGDDIDRADVTINGTTFELPDADQSCTEALAPGQPTDDVVAWLDESGACTDDGEIQIIGTASYDCPDGVRQLHYNDWGRGVDGGTWQAPFADDFTFDDIAQACVNTPTTTAD